MDRYCQALAIILNTLKHDLFADHCLEDFDENIEMLTMTGSSSIVPPALYCFYSTTTFMSLLT